MRQRVLHSCLPSYARDEVHEGGPACVVAIRENQVFDDDIATEVGAAQRQIASVLKVEGDGASVLMATSPADSFLVRTDPGSQATELRSDLSLLADHLARCGLATGTPVFTDDVEAELEERAHSQWICPVIFSSAIARAIGDEPAKRHRAAVKRLSGKTFSCKLAGFLNSADVNAEEEFLQFLDENEPPWVFKPSYSGGGRLVEIAGTRSEARRSWQRGREQWGSVTAQPYVAGQDGFTAYLIDPTSGTATRLLQGASTRNPGGDFFRSVWKADEQRTLAVPQAAALTFSSFIRESGASVLLITQDWVDDFKVCVDVNPRWAGFMPISIYRGRVEFHPSQVTQLILPRPTDPLSNIFTRLKPLECRAGREYGVVIYGTSNYPRPTLLVMLINDLDGRIEAQLRRSL